MPMIVRRLTAADRDAARQMFALLGRVFGETNRPLSDAYVDSLLGRADFWALAAYVDEQVVGGLTAYTLCLTREEAAEIFIYDIAVDPAQQRNGVGRALVHELRHAASAAGIEVSFVPVDNADEHALSFYRSLGGAPAPVTIFTFDAD